jgi:hypothetical protein
MVTRGGLLLLIAGLSLILGSLLFRARYASFGAGAAIAGALTGMKAQRLPSGVSDAIAIGALAVAVVIEMVIARERPSREPFARRSPHHAHHTDYRRVLRIRTAVHHVPALEQRVSARIDSVLPSRHQAAR